MSKLRELVAPMLAEQNERTFEDYMIPFSNSGEICESYFTTILETALQEDHDQDEAYEIVAPIATEILGFTKEHQPKIYRLLLLDIKKAHDRLLACQERKEVVVDMNVESVDVAQSKFEDIDYHLDNGWLLEVYEDRLEESGHVRAVLKRTVQFQGDVHERN